MLDTVDRALLEALERRLPMDHRPFDVLGKAVGLTEERCLERVMRLKAQGHLLRIAAQLDIHALGYRTVLAALRVDAPRAAAVAATVNAYPGAVQTVERDHPWRLWSLLEVPPTDSPEQVLQMIRTLARADEAMLLPLLRSYPVRHEGVTGDPMADHLAQLPDRFQAAITPTLPDHDRRVLRVVQDDLPLMEIPYAVWAEQADITEEALFSWLKRIEHLGYVREIKAVLPPRGAAPGARLTVMWQADEHEIDTIGEEIARFREVGACVRMAGAPAWPFTLLALVQGADEAAVRELIGRIDERIGRRPHTVFADVQAHNKRAAPYFGTEFELWWRHASEQLDIHN